jgi:hypothetical protein
MMKRFIADREKNQKVGVDKAHLARWTSRVLAKAFARKHNLDFKSSLRTAECPCY